MREQPQKGSFERTLVIYTLISPGVHLPRVRRRGGGVRARALLVPNISRDIGDVKMVLYELPKRKSFLLTTVLFAVDCKSTTTVGGRPPRFAFDRFQETAARQMFFSSNLC